MDFHNPWTSSWGTRQEHARLRIRLRGSADFRRADVQDRVAAGISRLYSCMKRQKNAPGRRSFERSEHGSETMNKE